MKRLPDDFWHHDQKRDESGNPERFSSEYFSFPGKQKNKQYGGQVQGKAGEYKAVKKIFIK